MCASCRLSWTMSRITVEWRPRLWQNARSPKGLSSASSSYARSTAMIAKTSLPCLWDRAIRLPLLRESSSSTALSVSPSVGALATNPPPSASDLWCATGFSKLRMAAAAIAARRHLLRSSRLSHIATEATIILACRGLTGNLARYPPSGVMWPVSASTAPSSLRHLSALLRLWGLGCVGKGNPWDLSTPMDLSWSTTDSSGVLLISGREC
mmetsp:Transcript_412/g.1536  ORF Transcript_412/g.1536 Transcript_412/m.1536 type:complete len:210 (-) Transcript_412:1991-2620(-)